MQIRAGGHGGTRTGFACWRQATASSSVRCTGYAGRALAGSNLYIAKNVALFGNFIGEYSNRTSSNAGNGGLRVTR
jgi:hypothetical protein